MSSLRQHRIAYSQNFLRSGRLVDRLLDRSGICVDDLVIEVGPGRGVITERLAARCRQVLAVEQDPILVEELGARIAHASNVALFAGDFLSFPLPLTAYKVFANIPFNITAAIVGKLTSGTSPPVDAYLAVQREAADRFLGTPRQTLVAVLLKPWFEPSVVHHFRPTDFEPRPGVEVVFLRLQRRPEPLVAPRDAALFGDFTAYAFSAWQPTVREALARILPRQAVASIERAAGVSLDRPPSSIPFASWLSLAGTFGIVAGEHLSAVHGARARLEQQQGQLQKAHRTRRSRSPGKTGRPYCGVGKNGGRKLGAKGGIRNRCAGWSSRASRDSRTGRALTERRDARRLVNRLLLLEISLSGRGSDPRCRWWSHWASRAGSPPCGLVGSDAALGASCDYRRATAVS
jgi:23S rRNA (adenine-N6)-dimethyltransferase